MRSRLRSLALCAAPVVLLGEAAAAAPVLTTLAVLNGGTTGKTPLCTLAADLSGNLYGTTQGGGTASGGTIFEVSTGPSTTVKTLYSFSSAVGTKPEGGLVPDGKGNFYGTTSTGGLNGHGTIFEYSPASNAVTPLASFGTENSIAASNGLVADAAGNLYGTTNQGGTSNLGTIFKYSASTGSLTTLFSFNGAMGQYPAGGALVIDSSGNLYGTTQAGGNLKGGTVFEFSTSSGMITTLASFSNSYPSPQGNSPQAGLTADGLGNLYGTSADTIFKINLATDSLTTLATYSFVDNGGPVSQLLSDAAGNLFGANNLYVVELAAGDSTLSTLASNGGGNTSSLAFGLTSDSSGNLYGATQSGGGLSSGTIYELTGSGFVVPEPNPSALSAISIAVSGAMGSRPRRRRCNPVR